MAKALNFLSLAVFFFTVCSSNPELETLLSFKSSLQNPKSLSSWNESLPFCNWVGITCRLGRVSSLELTSASLSGEIPPQLGELTHLRTLKLGLNSLTGNLPPEIGNLTSLVTLDLSGNGLEGKLPVEIGKLTRLKFLDLNSNFFSGQIPGEIFNNFRELTSVDISNNSLSGEIPPEIGNLTNLIELYIGTNSFSGGIPPEIGSLTRLQVFISRSCSISGPLPDSIGNLISLRHLDLSHNPLRCKIPKSIGRLKNLVELDLSFSEMNGTIPRELGHCKNLTQLVLDGNRLTGSIPGYFADLENLMVLDLDSNGFSGPIPVRIWDSSSLMEFSAGRNKLEGSLPAEIGNAVVLETLVLNDNRISGSIPKEIGNLSALSLLNLNSNHLEGSIPVEIGKCGSLTMLDLGNNSLTCSIPDEVTLSNILEGTNNFCNSNIIGDGGFGTVYKAKLVTKNNNDILVVAVKKLSHSKAQGDREFMAEMETLGKVKHKNLVSLLGYCSLGEEKLLVYEYMANGSLDTWLRDGLNPKPLDWATRLKIAIGSARGLAFLHHGFTPHVIHRDVKSSNILLDPDFEAKVADFGLARLISAYETHVSTEIAGTLGYIPPEYGQSGRASVKGDVYSYGVILLELVTGKEPTGPEFKEGEGGNLVGWVLQKVKKGEGVDVVDQSVVNGGGRLGVMMMMKVLEVAVGCLAEKPNDRPSMRQVLEGLKGIRGW
ncbi:Serine/threonine-protein kinase BRI1-like 2 [Linum perenne]